MSGIGHNNPPRDRSFKRRWALAVFGHSTKPSGAVALAFKLYMEMDADGKGAVISDREFCDATGCSERSCQNFKRWLIEEGFVHIHVKGARGRANEFVAHIPDGITAIDADIPNQLPAPITGKVEEDRQYLPTIANQITAIDAGNQQISARVADSRKNLPCAPTHAEVNNNIYNNYNNLSKKIQSNPSEQVAARDPAGVDYGALSEKLIGACNGALDNPVNCQGLASLAIPLMWMREGCDLETDILPTLHGYGRSAHGKRIRSWDYFTGGVTKARDTRLRGLPAVGVDSPSGGAKESKTERMKRIFKKAEDEKRNGQ